MSQKERPSYFPHVPEVYPRTEYVPAATPAAAREPVPTEQTQTSRAELVAAAYTPPPLDAGDQAETKPGDTPAAAEARERERVTLTGRLGQNPRVRTTPKGTLIAQFPLGIKDEVDLTKTTWHQVVAFQQRAEQARDTLKQGDAVEVIGYRHERQIPGRNGPRTVAEIYATLLKPRS